MLAGLHMLKGVSMITGFSIIFTCLLIGEAISAFLHVPIPGNVIGMGLLTVSLAVGLVRLDDVRPVADVLLKHLALLFVPPGRRHPALREPAQARMAAHQPGLKFEYDPGACHCRPAATTFGENT
jgi:hypothetical protein